MSTVEILKAFEALPRQERAGVAKRILQTLCGNPNVVERLMRRIENADVPEDVWRGIEDAEDGPGFDWQAFDSPTKESPSAISKEPLAKLFDNGKRKLARKTAVEELEQTTGCKKTACYAALEGLEAVKSNLFAFAPAIKRRGVNPHLRRHPRQIIAAGFQKLFCHS